MLAWVIIYETESSLYVERKATDVLLYPSLNLAVKRNNLVSMELKEGVEPRLIVLIEKLRGYD